MARRASFKQGSSITGRSSMSENCSLKAILLGRKDHGKHIMILMKAGPAPLSVEQSTFSTPIHTHAGSTLSLDAAYHPPAVLARCHCPYHGKECTFRMKHIRIQFGLSSIDNS